MNDTFHFLAAQDQLNALYTEAARERQAICARSAHYRVFWRRVWTLGHWRLTVRLSQIA